jgi:hypothetical protein
MSVFLWWGRLPPIGPPSKNFAGKKSAIDVLEKFEGKTLPRLYSAFKAGAIRRQSQQGFNSPSASPDTMDDPMAEILHAGTPEEQS